MQKIPGEVSYIAYLKEQREQLGITVVVRTLLGCQEIGFRV